MDKYGRKGNIILTFPKEDYCSSQNERDLLKDKKEGSICRHPIKFKKSLENIIKFIKEREKIIHNLFLKFEFMNTASLIICFGSFNFFKK